MPNSTTTGDFLSRFDEPDIIDLMESTNKTRKIIWTKQPTAFSKQAFLNVDRTIAGITSALHNLVKIVQIEPLVKKSNNEWFIIIGMTCRDA